jgi:SPP1 family predicted phage head-tail adaptor
MITAGELRDEIDIQELVESQASGSGAVTEGWQSVWETRAHVKVLDGKEEYEGDAAVSRASHEVRTRYHGGIDATMQIVWNGATLKIVGVTHDQLRTELVFKCSENKSR